MEPVLAAFVVMTTAGLLGWTLYDFLNALCSEDEGAKSTPLGQSPSWEIVKQAVVRPQHLGANVM